MFYNIIKITLRNIWKNIGIVFINLIGMGLAIACCILAYINYQYSSQWDFNHENINEIFRVQFINKNQNTPSKYAIIPVPLGPNIKQNISEVDNIVRLKLDNFIIKNKEDLFKEKIAYVDKDFFSVFTYLPIDGNFVDIENKSKIYISEKIAYKYFGRKEVAGEIISQNYTNNGEIRTKAFEIGGVFQPNPSNSSFDFEIITVFDNYLEVNTNGNIFQDSWREWVDALFLRIKKPSKRNIDIVENQIQQFVAPQNQARRDFKISEYFLEPLNGMAKRNLDIPRTNRENLKSGLLDSATFVPLIMAIFLLLLTCFNFINTSIARSENRLKEIGIRKVLGGSKSQLIFQFLIESFLLCFLSLLLGLILAKFIVPSYSDMWSWIKLELIYSENLQLLFFIMILIVVITIISGLYPSYYISSFQPVKILKGKPKFGGVNWFTNFLLGVQFSISMIVIAMAFAFYQNGRFQENFNLGFATSGIISCTSYSENELEVFRDALSENPNIHMLAGTSHHLTNSLIRYPVKYNETEMTVDILDVGYNYLDLMDVQLISGRHFENKSETDYEESVIVTQEFISKFNIKNPLNERILIQDSISYYIIGVVRNLYPRGLWNPIQPTMFRVVPEKNYKQLLVKTSPSNVKMTNEDMRATWANIFPNRIYQSSLIANEFEETIVLNQNISIIFAFLGLMTIILSSISLYTLISLNINRKIKVIGIRKVLGASLTDIAWSVNKGFVFILTLSVISGGLISYFFIDIIMDSIWEYYKGLSLLSSAFSVLIMILVLVVSVSYKTYKVAVLNPVHTLRIE
jgi:putative ABC transport system permease protein